MRNHKAAEKTAEWLCDVSILTLVRVLWNKPSAVLTGTWNAHLLFSCALGKKCAWYHLKWYIALFSMHKHLLGTIHWHYWSWQLWLNYVPATTSLSGTGYIIKTTDGSSHTSEGKETTNMLSLKYLYILVTPVILWTQSITSVILISPLLPLVTTV